MVISDDFQQLLTRICRVHCRWLRCSDC